MAWCTVHRCTPGVEVSWQLLYISRRMLESEREKSIYIYNIRDTYTHTKRANHISTEQQAAHRPHERSAGHSPMLHTHTHTLTHTHPFEFFAHTPRSARSALESAAQMHMHARAAVRGKCSASVQP